MTNPDKNYVITPEAAQTAGAVSYWRAAGSISIKALHDAWVAAGLDPALIRKAPEPETALRRAVLDLAERKHVSDTTEVRVLIRPCKEQHEWAVVEETAVKGKAPTYRTVAIVRFAAGQPAVADVSATAQEHDSILARIANGFTAQQGLFDPADITGWLVKLAYANGAVTLRDSGGVYFIPRSATEFWTKAANVIETVSGQAHRIFRIPAMKNTEAVEAIIAAVTTEAEQVATEIDAEVAKGVGPRALEARKAAADALLAKVASYEELVGQQIAVRERVEALRASLAQVALAAMFSSEAAA